MIAENYLCFEMFSGGGFTCACGHGSVIVDKVVLMYLTAHTDTDT